MSEVPQEYEISPDTGLIARYERFLEAVAKFDIAETTEELEALLVQVLDIEEETACFAALEITGGLISFPSRPDSKARVIWQMPPGSAEFVQVALRTVAYIATAPDSALSAEEVRILTESTIRFASDSMLEENANYESEDNETVAEVTSDDAKHAVAELYLKEVAFYAEEWLQRIAEARDNEFVVGLKVLSAQARLERQFAPRVSK